MGTGIHYAQRGNAACQQRWERMRRGAAAARARRRAVPARRCKPGAWGRNGSIAVLRWARFSQAVQGLPPSTGSSWRYTSCVSKLERVVFDSSVSFGR